jgi:hypothetical protein
MSKVYMNVSLRVIVDTDLTSPDDIMDNIDINALPNTENVEVYDTEVQSFQVEDSK